MKRHLIGAIMIVLLSSSPVLAEQDRSREHRNAGSQQDEGREWGRQSQRGDSGRHRGWGQERGRDYRWGRGQQMGYNDWRNARRVDYRRYHLRQPPRGYEWRQNNDRFILGAIATGIIASVIMSSGR